MSICHLDVDFGNDQFKNTHQLTPVLCCSICWNPPTEPRLCPHCSGIHCLRCLHSWYTNRPSSPASGTCPTCYVRVGLDRYMASPWIRDIHGITSVGDASMTRSPAAPCRSAAPAHADALAAPTWNGAVSFHYGPVAVEKIAEKDLKACFWTSFDVTKTLDLLSKSGCRAHPSQPQQLYCSRCRDFCCTFCSLWGAHFLHDVKCVRNMNAAEQLAVLKTKERSFAGSA